MYFSETELPRRARVHWLSNKTDLGPKIYEKIKDDVVSFLFFSSENKKKESSLAGNRTRGGRVKADRVTDYTTRES